jgi:ribonucleoside-diphosphate reductase alpha chain
MPVTRSSVTHKFSLAGHEGYITAGKYDDGTLGEVFLTDFGKEGSTLRGMMGAFATVLSIGIQYGVPVEVVVRKLSYMRFEPEGMTENPEIRNARSIPDYIARWLASQFLGADACEELGVMTKEVRERQAAALDAQYAAAPVPAREDSGAVETLGPQTGTLGATDHRQARTGGAAEGPICPVDGSIMWRTGACVTCPTCGHNTGCG